MLSVERKNNKVSIDSNALSYLVDAMMNGKNPVGNEADEKIALLRVYLYPDDFLYVSPTVRAEFKKIKDEKKRRDHQEITDVLFEDILELDDSLVKTRTTEYNHYHSGKNDEKDCKILAESEIGECNLFLTYDQGFYKKLHDKTHSIKMIKPSDFWVSLGIPRKSKPVTEPHPTNPLSKETWWRW
jgi:predicted nucleic acid-binding protein